LLQFNKLRLTGFKSFVDSTDLEIQLGLTGIVGPNGCGKSNLVEALKWIMGETSAKQMRGGAMDDVIFGGTSDRPSRNVAEVILGLDNSDRSAPLQYNTSDEVEISRRIEREKGSTYRINGKETRARDVQLMFADSATGARSTALVSQGRIGAVINAKATQRRSLLEEAAGITGLHSRRHEAELRLKGAETNLERLDDILITLDNQLANLKKQSRQATRYRNLSDHIRKAEAALMYLKWTAAENNLGEQQSQLSVVEKAVAEMTVLASKAHTQLDDLSQGLPELRHLEASDGAALQKLVHTRDGLDAEERRLNQQLNETHNRLQHTKADFEREHILLDDATKALHALKAESLAIQEAQDDQQHISQQAEADLKIINQDVAALEQKLTALTEQVVSSEARKNGLENRIRELSERLQKLNDRQQDIHHRHKQLETDNPNAEQLELTEQTLSNSRDALDAARKRLEKFESDRQNAAENVRSATAELQDARNETTRLEAEAQALAKVLVSADEDLWPPLIDALNVKPGFEAALGAALGEDLSLPADEAAPAHWKTLKPMDGTPELPNGATPLSDTVTAPPALSRRLSQIGLVDDDDMGETLSRDLKQGQRLVSKVGSLWRWDGFTVTSAASTPAAARLEQKNRLKEARVLLGKSQKNFFNLEKALEKTKNDEQKIIDQFTQARSATSDADRQFNQARDAQDQVREQSRAHSSQLASLSEALRGVTADIEETENLLKTVQRERSDLADITTERQQVEQLRIELTEKRDRQVHCQSHFSTLTKAAEDQARRLKAIQGETQSWTTRHANASKQSELLTNRIEVADREILNLTARPDAIETQRLELLDRISKAEEKRAKTADKLAIAEQSHRQAEHTLRDAETELGRAREGMVRIQGTVEQARQNCLSIAERVKDKLSCRTDQLFEVAELKSEADIPELFAIERKVERLLKERDTMGAVNLRAEQEQTEMIEQIDTLVNEREDLLKAIAKLRHAISELNREGRQRLLTSFKQVNEHFQDLFKQLFGGGKAYLELTDHEDPLLAGLEIMASPPGKKLQALSLLSGGEQALTALSLLFAVFLTNPAPICVLDEVDAPLDDANVDRFCSMLEKMAHQQKTRFLVITHHRMTMARMDRLFGVTMAERGVSQLVSVDLQKAEELTT